MRSIPLIALSFAIAFFPIDPVPFAEGSIVKAKPIRKAQRQRQRRPPEPCCQPDDRSRRAKGRDESHETLAVYILQDDRCERVDADGKVLRGKFVGGEFIAELDDDATGPVHDDLDWLADRGLVLRLSCGGGPTGSIVRLTVGNARSTVSAAQVQGSQKWAAPEPLDAVLPTALRLMNKINGIVWSYGIGSDGEAPRDPPLLAPTDFPPKECLPTHYLDGRPDVYDCP